MKYLPQEYFELEMFRQQLKVAVLKPMRFSFSQ
jgi:hypothetical protein